MALIDITQRNDIFSVVITDSFNVVSALSANADAGYIKSFAGRSMAGSAEYMAASPLMTNGPCGLEKSRPTMEYRK